ncbi:MAG: glycoside hydrolase family 127 protein [Candidatus Binatia bacterium]
MAIRSLPFASVELRAPFWRARQRDRAEAALLAQWQHLEAAGTIDNFRIAAGRRSGPRRGLFFVDSDAHKWADAAARTLQLVELPPVATHLDELIDVVAAAQAEDGYVFTYNQVHFPGTRWSTCRSSASSTATAT